MIEETIRADEKKPPALIKLENTGKNSLEVAKTAAGRSMSRILSTEKRYLFSYFLGIIAAGTVLLSLPFAWNGQSPLKLIDALFTAASAVCVTGLTTVDTAAYSRFGQIVILLLIQTGGLGIITFSTRIQSGLPQS